MLGRRALERSLARQAAVFEGSIVLTPVDNFPIVDRYGPAVSWLHGLYASDKQRSEDELRETAIQFAGRQRITQDLARIHANFAGRFDAKHASLRLLSGLHAHMILMMGLARVGDTIALLPVEAGGHFATPGIAERLGLKVLPLAVDSRRMCVDRAATLAALASTKPDLLFIDRSEGLKYEDFSWLSDVPARTSVFDSSQYAAQIMHRQYANPFDWGFQLQVFTLHKSFPGPQKAAVIGRDDDAWAGFKAAVGAFVSSSHIENSYVAGLILDRSEALAVYAARLVPVAEALERALGQRGVAVVSRDRVGDEQWPGTQHVWIALRDQARAFDAWRRLERVRIQTNYRLLPYGLGWGLRLGVTAAVARGLTAASVLDLADIVARALHDGSDRELRHRTTALARAMAADSPALVQP